jgi:cytoskeleton protein RodZ
LVLSYPAAVNQVHMSMTLGEKLRQAREERGIPISEVAEQTRISRLYLESIENDDYKPLPGGIFNKGFVKSYAKFIGLDEQEALQDYAKIVAQSELRNEHELRVYRPEVLTDESTSGSMIPTIIFAGIILALMTAGILFLVNYIQNQPESLTHTNTNASNVNAAFPTDANTAVPLPSFEELRLDLTTFADKVSINAFVDGKAASQALTAGQTQTFTAKESLRISYYRGFAEQVRVVFNGKEMKPPATAKGNTVSIEVNRQNAARIWQAGDFGVSETEIAETSPTPATASPTPAQPVTASPAVTATPKPTPAVKPSPHVPETPARAPSPTVMPTPNAAATATPGA